ncbi:hypothetical protein [Streptomyces sp. NPDC048196]|uniref:hypothetical protein n=1 Tax=Streptomyces sp. NPDC048196 TaxID=3154712 RepID=UPI0033E3EE79
MALGKKGSRRIVVDGVTYRWRHRRRPTYSQALCWSPCTYAAERAEQHGAILVVTTDRPHTGNWLSRQAAPVRPADVANHIRIALVRGWRPTHPGSPFELDLSAGFISSP